MKTKLPLLLSSLAVALTAATGCATSPDTTDDDDAVVGDDAEVRAAQATCTPEKYNKAFGHYRKAVYAAKDRLRGKTCEDDIYLWSIADDGAAAVMTCPAFKDVIRTSPYAAPLREVLKSSLTLKSLTGELLVLRDSQWANWSRVETLFPGTTFYMGTNGAFGSHKWIDFKADGKATYHKLEFLDADPYVRVKTAPATYRVERTGADKDPRKVKVVSEGQTETFDLKVSAPEGDFSSAPVFQLVPPGVDPTHFWETLNSLVSECDA